MPPGRSSIDPDRLETGACVTPPYVNAAPAKQNDEICIAARLAALAALPRAPRELMTTIGDGRWGRETELGQNETWWLLGKGDQSCVGRPSRTDAVLKTDRSTERRN